MRNPLPPPATCTGWPRCTSRCPTTPAPHRRAPALQQGRPADERIPLETASCRASASTCATSPRAAEITPSDLEAAVKKSGHPVPKGAPFCSAPATTSAPFRARICDGKFRRERRRHRMAGRPGPSCIRHWVDAEVAAGLVNQRVHLAFGPGRIESIRKCTTPWPASHSVAATFTPEFSVAYSLRGKVRSGGRCRAKTVAALRHRVA